MKNVMVPEELFGKLLKYHLLDQKQEEDDIKKGLEKKLDTMINRELYSKYKTVATDKGKSVRCRREVIDYPIIYRQIIGCEREP